MGQLSTVQVSSIIQAPNLFLLALEREPRIPVATLNGEAFASPLFLHELYDCQTFELNQGLLTSLVDANGKRFRGDFRKVLSTTAHTAVMGEVLRHQRWLTPCPWDEHFKSTWIPTMTEAINHPMVWQRADLLASYEQPHQFFELPPRDLKPLQIQTFLLARNIVREHFQNQA